MQRLEVLVADGLTNAAIAEWLWITPGTVRRHLENVYEKLGVHTLTAAVARSRAGRLCRVLVRGVTASAFAITNLL